MIEETPTSGSVLVVELDVLVDDVVLVVDVVVVVVVLVAVASMMAAMTMAFTERSPLLPQRRTTDTRQD